MPRRSNWFCALTLLLGAVFSANNLSGAERKDLLCDSLTVIEATSAKKVNRTLDNWTKKQGKKLCKTDGNWVSDGFLMQYTVDAGDRDFLQCFKMSRKAWENVFKAEQASPKRKQSQSRPEACDTATVLDKPVPADAATLKRKWLEGKHPGVTFEPDQLVTVNGEMNVRINARYTDGKQEMTCVAIHDVVSACGNPKCADCDEKRQALKSGSAPLIIMSNDGKQMTIMDVGK